MHTQKFNQTGSVAFGFVMTFSSGFGQTFFISLFNQDLRTAFSLSHSEIGSLYSFGTMASALTIIWAGKLLDIIELKFYTLLVCIGLAVACFTMSFVNGPLLLAFSFFLLRLFGQGLSGHTGITTASRAPQQFRGRTISLSGLGFSFAEMTLPIVTVSLLSIYHWRDVWQLYAGVELVAIVIVTQFLLMRFAVSNRGEDSTDHDDSTQSWTRYQVVRDWRFWKIAPAMFAPSIISTGLFFHQQSLAAYKGFEFSIWASAIAVYSIAAVTTSLLAGLAVDKWAGASVVRLYLAPFITATLVVALVDVSLLPFIYYGLMGMTVGIATPAVNALWMELYGSTHIAAIRSLTHALMVFGSALGPVIFGFMLDSGFEWRFILLCCVTWMIFASLLLATTPLQKIPHISMKKG